MEQSVQKDSVKTENRSQWISAAEMQDGDEEELNCRHESPLGGDGRYIGDHRISGRRRFLPQPHHSPNRVHPPTNNPPRSKFCRNRDKKRS